MTADGEVGSIPKRKYKSRYEYIREREGIRNDAR